MAIKVTFIGTVTTKINVFLKRTKKLASLLRYVVSDLLLLALFDLH